MWERPPRVGEGWGLDPELRTQIPAFDGTHTPLLDRGMRALPGLRVTR